MKRIHLISSFDPNVKSMYNNEQSSLTSELSADVYLYLYFELLYNLQFI